MNRTVVGCIILIAVVSLIANVALYDRYSSERVLVTVNGEPIHKKDLDDRLDYLYATDVLRQMIVTDLILQEAKRKNAMPSDEDVQKSYQQLLRIDPKSVETAREYDPQMTFFMEGLRASLALRNLRVLNVPVTTDEIAAYYAAHKSDFVLPQQSQTTIVLTADEVDAATAKRLLDDNVSPAVVAEQPGLMVVGINAASDTPLLPSVRRAIMKMRPGDVKLIPAGAQFAVIRCVRVDAEVLPPLDSIRADVAIAARLAKAPSEQVVLERLRRDASITVEASKYATAVPTGSDETIGSDTAR
jgi:hypothetical protein